MKRPEDLRVVQVFVCVGGFGLIKGFDRRWGGQLIRSWFGS